MQNILEYVSLFISFGWCFKIVMFIYTCHLVYNSIQHWTLWQWLLRWCFYKCMVFSAFNYFIWVAFTYLAVECSFILLQADWGQDKIPCIWDLIFAPACLSQDCCFFHCQNRHLHPSIEWVKYFLLSSLLMLI